MEKTNLLAHPTGPEDPRHKPTTRRPWGIPPPSYVPATTNPPIFAPKETRLPVNASRIPLKVLGSAFDQFLPWFFRHLLDNLRPKYRPVPPSGSFFFSPIVVALPILSPVECAPAYAGRMCC
jgi:hypothetical protein